MATNRLAQEVMDHALAHYNEGGWDVICEAWDLEQIKAACVRYDRHTGRKIYLRALSGVLWDSILLDCVSVYADRQADAINSAF